MSHAGDVQPPVRGASGTGPGLWRVVSRLLCPRCGRSRAFAGWFRMPRACAACGLVFEREAGYWIGAMYFNYGVTALLLFLVWIALDLVAGVAWDRVLATLVVLGLVFPVGFFRYSRMIWLALDLRLDPPEDPDHGGDR